VNGWLRDERSFVDSQLRATLMETGLNKKGMAFAMP
jgi:hypothetical protein